VWNGQHDPERAGKTVARLEGGLEVDADRVDARVGHSRQADLCVAIGSPGRSLAERVFCAPAGT
jgi:hypothetical protein